MVMRGCHKCKRNKPRSEFSRLPDGSRRFYTWCDECREDLDGRRLYVVHLNDEVGPRSNPEYPSVYVGQSVRAPEDRFFQHKAGIKKGKGYVYKYGEWLMFRLFRNSPTYMTHEEVLRAERQLGHQLTKKGYTVYGAH
jgi:hypothetical protein